MHRALTGAGRVLAKAFGLRRPRVAPDAHFEGLGEAAQRAEESRYRQATDDAAVANMPFSDLRGAPTEVYRLGLVLAALKSGPRDEVLDFGAGTCWLSAILNRMGLKTVALDVSPAALEIGRRSFALDARQRPDLEPEFCTYDGRTLPFDDARFDAVVSYAAFHHVANQEEILGEMFRVLRPGGRVVFCEPLLEHSVSTTAQVEVEAYGFLERDIDLVVLERQARRIGFDRLVLKPYTQTPDDELDSNSMLRNLTFSLEQAAKRYLDSYCVFFLLKPGAPAPDSSRPGELLANIAAAPARLDLPPAGAASIEVEISNNGDTLWLARQHPQGGYVTLGCQLLDAEKRRIDRDYLRFPLPADVPPGEALSLRVEVTAPRNPGDYWIRLDMVDEGMCWFEEVGSPTTVFSLTVATDKPENSLTHE